MPKFTNSSFLSVFKRIFIYTAALLIFSVSAYARNVSLQWDPDSEPDLSHYVVYWGISSGNYTSNSGDIGLVTQYSVVIPDDGRVYYFAVTVVDLDGFESDYSNEVFTGGGSPVSPYADAGPDQNVEEGYLVTLDGSNSSDSDGSITAWQWVQTGGTTVTLSNPAAIQPTFTSPFVAPAGETLTFELTVTDSDGLTDTDTCIVNVVWVNDPPVANAGPDQNVEEGVQVVLNGSSSVDPDGSISAWQWTQTAGTPVTLSNSTAMQTTFTSPLVAPQGEALTFELRVTDAQGLQSTDTCIVNVAWVNDPPVANAGPDQNVEEDVQVVLNGSNSVDPDGSISAWQWTQTAGTPVTLSSSTAMQTTFTSPLVAPQGEALTFELRVTDAQGLQSTDTCIVNVAWVNDPPVANAGPDQNVEEDVQVVLNGSNSVDPDGSISAWQWTQTAGTPVTLSSSTAMQPTFTSPLVAPQGEALTFELRVTDAQGLQSTDTCIVNVAWVNDPPVAKAGPDQNVEEGIQVVLDGSGSSDPDGGIVSWLWEQTGGTPVTLSSPTTIKPTFSAPLVSPNGESLTFSLTVTDSQGLKNTDSCIVNVVWVNNPPVSDAGSNQSVTSGDPVVLDGSGSVDSDGTIVSYQWVQTGGTPVVLDDASAVDPVFESPYVDSESETLTFKLLVTDNGGLQSSDECTVVVSPSVQTQVLYLKKGWNLISISNGLEIIPIEDTFSPIMDMIISIWSYDNGMWRVYNPADIEHSDLLEVEPGTGLWINTNEVAELSNVVIGSSANEIDLSAGWNLVGFASSGSQDTGDVISSITGNVISVWAFQNGKWKVYDPEKPEFSDLTTMEPGCGYWIRVNTACSWTY